MKIYTRAKCPDCARVFDLLDEDQASEWYYGHDCDIVETVAWSSSNPTGEIIGKGI